MYKWHDVSLAIELTKKGLSVNEIKEFLNYEKKPLTTPYDLFNLICDYYNVHPKLVKGSDRDRKYVKVRKMFSYFACCKLGVIQDDVAFVLNRHRTNLVHYNRQIQGFIDIKDFDTLQDIKNINKLINR